jgi:hypothetical protein
VADEPPDHEVVRDQQFVPAVVAGDAEVLDSGLQGRRIFVALVDGYAIEPGKPPVRVSITLSGGGHRRAVRNEVAGVSRHLWEMTGDDVGRLGRPGQWAVVDRRERYRTQPVAQSVRLLASELREASVRG